MTSTLTRAAALPPIDRETGARIARAELQQSIALYGALSPQEWDAPTECEPWRVREMVAHVIGAMEGSVRLPVLLRHRRQGRKRYPERNDLDAMNEAQVDDRRGWTPDRLLAAFTELGPKAIEARRKVPSLLRRLPVPMPDGGKMTLGYLNDVVYPRDLWMHRLDAARATGREFVVGRHDRDLVAGVVRDLALAWAGPPLTLSLTGPAGGSWLLGGEGGPEVRMDAVEYCRLLSGRDGRPNPQAPQTAQAAVEALVTARVLF